MTGNRRRRQRREGRWAGGGGDQALQNAGGRNRGRWGWLRLCGAKALQTTGWRNRGGLWRLIAGRGGAGRAELSVEAGGLACSSAAL